MQIIGQKIGTIELYDKALYLLENGVAVIIFRKKNGEIRTMLCTRDLRTCDIMNIGLHTDSGMSDTSIMKRQKAREAGNITVTDLIAGEARIFNINRVMYSLWLTSPINSEEIDALYGAYQYCKERWTDYDELDRFTQADFMRRFAYPKDKD